MLRRGLFHLLGPCLAILLVACGGPAALPPATPTAPGPPPTLAPTPIPPTLPPMPCQPIPTSEDAIVRLHLLMKDWPKTIPQVHQAALEAVLIFLKGLPEGLKTLQADPGCLDALNAYIGSVGTQPMDRRFQVADLEGDGTVELLVALVSPVSLVRQVAGEFTIEDLPNAVYWPPDNTWPTVQQVADLTGDGRPEIVLAYLFAGASYAGTELLVLGREGEGWVERLRVGLNNWAGGGEWRLEPQPDGTQAIVTTCAVFGVFDAKLVAHPLQRDTYRWDGQRFTLAASVQDPPSNRRQVVNLAEAALRAGAYRAALDIYRRLLDEPDLPDEPKGGTAEGKPDWVAFATLRLGQVYALLGEPEEALTTLAEAEKAGSTVGRLAQRFHQAYAAGHDPAAAWAALLEDTEIFAEQYYERGNLVSFPGNAFDALYPGMALAAVLNDRPRLAEGDPEALRTAWAGYGLETGTPLIADLDGDGQAEVVVIQRVASPQPPELEGGLAPGWVLDRGPDGWFAALLLAGPERNKDVRPEGPLPVPGTNRQAVRLGTWVRSWDGERVIRYRDARTWALESDPFDFAECPLRWR
jgi:tetratricopeptide (TPR) repeat protein